jgi:hypothetical protein
LRVIPGSRGSVKFSENRGAMIEKRCEKRYAVPDLYREYIRFKIRKGSDEYEPMELLDFSSHGIRVESTYGLSVDSIIECLISAPKSLTREISFIAKVRYCIQEEPDGEYLVGAEIIQISNKIWLDVFLKVHDFIKARMGGIY